MNTLVKEIYRALLGDRKGCLCGNCVEFDYYTSKINLNILLKTYKEK